MYLILFAITIHLIFLASIFDIYFTSPIVHGMVPHPLPPNPPAKRLVLFSADGLRAEKFFTPTIDNIFRAPFLHNITRQKGTCGVSHTRVPTESRPGHVALMAGFYEDVSAVTKGWKENPVEFDSVFNRSRYTWAWGSPDIVDIFTKVRGEDGGLRAVGNIFPETYSAEFEDFAASPVQLDVWVFDKFKEFLNRAKNDKHLMQMLHSDKIVFFLHLLGMDTTGHVYKPHSKMHDDNLLIVDRGIQETVKLLENFYGDDEKTAYVFTSDHGMTDWGSHGSGGMDETQTPFVAWGAGVMPPRLDSQDGLRKFDIRQVDVAPLVATLLGIPVPVHSVGKLPLDYVDASAEYRTRSYLANAKQMYEQLGVKMRRKQQETFSWLFSPFAKLDKNLWEIKVAAIEQLLDDPEQHETMLVSSIDELIVLSEEGQLYYQNYDRRFLSAMVTLGYFGWICFILLVILDNQYQEKVRSRDARIGQSNGRVISFGAFGGVSWIVISLLQGSSRPAFMYGLLPVFTWTAAACRFEQVRNVPMANIVSGVLTALQFIVGCEILVLSFFYRQTVSVGLILTGFWLARSSQAPKYHRIMWLASSVMLAVFPLLDVVGKSRNSGLIAGVYQIVPLYYDCHPKSAVKPEKYKAAGLIISYLAGFGGLGAQLGVLLWNWTLLRRDRQASIFSIIQSGLLVSALIVVYITAKNAEAHLPTGMLFQTVSWLLLGTGYISPVLSSRFLHIRLLSVITALFTSYILMTIAYEGLFFILLSVHLLLWIDLEFYTAQPKVSLFHLTISESFYKEDSTHSRPLQLNDLRRVFFSVFFTLLAFFGTGNIACVNSFDPVAAFCFVTVFRPFVMGLILLCKVLIPFILVGCAFHVVVVICGLSTRKVYLIALLISDFMALQFFFLVRTEGSWLEIGTSISHYVIVMGIILFTGVLRLVSWVLMTSRVDVLWIKLQTHSRRSV